jgi:hypothetical protein
MTLLRSVNQTLLATAAYIGILMTHDAMRDFRADHPGLTKAGCFVALSALLLANWFLVYVCARTLWRIGRHALLNDLKAMLGPNDSLVVSNSYRGLAISRYECNVSGETLSHAILDMDYLAKGGR